jgi:putative endonuclease
LEKNFTIRGGEIDIIVENEDTCVFVEVKVVDYVNDLFSYISPKKLQTLTKTIQAYVFKHPTHKEMRVDIAFVKDNCILEIYENVTNS